MTLLTENRIDRTFQRLRNKKEKALIPYIMAGDPSLEMTEKFVLALETGGADLVEIGVPFTDPLADGPVIQKAAGRGLKNKTTLSGIFQTVKRLREQTEIPIILMSYYNPIFRYGEERFLAHARQSGVDGVIIPDLPAGESHSWESFAKKENIKTIFLLAPTSSESRIKKVAGASSGFIYYVALTGITGAKLTIGKEIEKRIKKIRKHSSLPVAVGFGISNPREAREISRNADGIIVGSAIVKRIEEDTHPSVCSSLTNFIRSLKKSLLK
ncbi:MAG: tryptophan synthase subunit alpha [Nitrospirae bacterium]|nr:tryptophan synthase subunit alpha [Nitrospirota bacterium]